MDKIANYREKVKSLLRNYTANLKQDDGVEVELIFDQEREHYLWMDVGWEGSKRLYHPVIHNVNQCLAFNERSK
ncbi:element excision factor XisI family protein [Spirulina sp. CS-785/01]|uniref:element excision factor XisI family protein n=1 Tax=Spirulina sp. CS-785/01 TaxID=3021716 RepID=UPI00232C7AF8|nr:element excision factor XisI family protein [Spirulina sp. CS-785/01]MDB9314520.1 element excision factor XisI family protein [Spirulina sp. CS-785/01]